MIKFPPKKPIRTTEQNRILAAIDQVTHLCQVPARETALDYVMRELDALRSSVLLHWPLPPEVKSQIDLGPFAAKNISDWNSDLADSLMALDYSLQHDGASIEKLLPLLVVQSRQKVAY